MSQSDPSSDHSHKTAEQGKSLEDVQLALLSQSVFDIPPRTRFVLVLVGILGIGIIVMESLVGGQQHTVQLDKIIHFSGYAILSMVFVLALRPMFYVPALIGLVAMGMAIELLQTQTGRSFDLMDELANSVGIAIGSVIGLIIRTIYSYIKTELAAADVRKNLLEFQPGELILREGQPIQKFYVIKDGQVEVSKQVNGKPMRLGTAGPGEVIGILGMIQGTPQYTTIHAQTQTRLYGMDLDQLMDSAGGREQPASLVLQLCADRMMEVVEKLTHAQARLKELGHGDDDPIFKAKF